MTYREICDRLQIAGIESAAWDAELLIEHFCGVGRAELLADPDRSYETEELEEAVERRAARYPLQYLLGEWGFYRDTFLVSPDCLIPRSDTEVLVEEAVRLLPTGAHFADLCTGSGCIAVSVLGERRDTHAVAVDKFPATLSIACQNAERCGVRDRFSAAQADLLLPDFYENAPRFDAILCNPPYIRTSVIEELEKELFSEPIAALDGGEDGLVFYRKILSECDRLLNDGGFVLFEIGFDQAEEVTRLGREYGFAHTRVIRDLGGQARVVYLAKCADKGADGSIS